MARIDKIQLRRDSAADWVTAAPTLAAGEVGFEEDTGLAKIGDGSTAWASQPYIWGGIVQEKTAAYTLTKADQGVLADAASGAITITLPAAASCKYRQFWIKKIDATNNVTVDGAGSETIDGATTKVLSTQYESVVLVSDGTEWWIV